MRKKIFILLGLIIVLFLGIIIFLDINGPLRRKMLEYYSDDSNYEKVTGIVVEKFDKSRDLGIVIISGSSSTYYSDFAGFNLHLYSKYYDYIDVNDTIIITTAPRYFCDGHDYPIVSLEKDGHIFFSFEEGKKAYLNWIQETLG